MQENELHKKDVTISECKTSNKKITEDIIISQPDLEEQKIKRMSL